MRPNTSKKDYHKALKEAGLFEEVVTGVTPKTRAELEAFVVRFGGGDITLGGDSVSIGVESDGSATVFRDNEDDAMFPELALAIDGTQINGKPLIESIGHLVIRATVIL